MAFHLSRIKDCTYKIRFLELNGFFLSVLNVCVCLREELKGKTCVCYIKTDVTVAYVCKICLK